MAVFLPRLAARAAAGNGDMLKFTAIPLDEISRHGHGGGVAIWLE